MQQKVTASFNGFDKQVKTSVLQVEKQIGKGISAGKHTMSKNLDWLIQNMPPYLFITMKEEKTALMNLAWGMDTLSSQQQNRIVLDDRPGKLIMAVLDRPGSVNETLNSLRHRPIVYAEINHSLHKLPEACCHLEIQRFEFGGNNGKSASGEAPAKLIQSLRKDILRVLEIRYSDFDATELTRLLNLMWLNNPGYVKISPPERLARGVWMYQQAQKHDGVFVGLDESPETTGGRESRLLFSAMSPPHSGYLAQITEVLQRLDVGVRRSYSLDLRDRENSAVLNSFYVVARNGQPMNRNSRLYAQVKNELYSTRILSPSCQVYYKFISKKLMSGEDSALLNAFIAFCHSSLAHVQPDRFDLEVVKTAFCSHPDIAQDLVQLFRLRFDPDAERNPKQWQDAADKTVQAIESYNTGHGSLDEIRRIIFRTCFLFIKHTLKTNFFVHQKQALAFRLDPGYLNEMGPEFNSDLPSGDPFRITFFFGRAGFGYHVGFSDIARGGWRTIISRSDDEYISNCNTLFRESYVLASTQHLKNKDIYEGGSKMALVLDARKCSGEAEVKQKLHDLQRCALNAFLDIFITSGGKAADSRVVDYYQEDEPIELGPDENLDNSMIEYIARQSLHRGYVLGIGLISSKKLGINHKEYGVTSLGVIRTAVIALSEMQRDPVKQPFTVRFTGGPGGDVAGNAMRLLIDKYPMARIVAIVDGPGMLHDPAGVDSAELRRLTLKDDITEFNPEKLHPGGCLIFRNQRRQEALRNLHRMVVKNGGAVEERWITADEYQRHAQELTFRQKADLFLPCGGRPETIDAQNWRLMLNSQGAPCVDLIVEGANSFITPEARSRLQDEGVVIIRDSSANKCGVIASSYEILANLLMSPREFTAHKEEYVKDVLAILDRRATQETRLIFRRWNQSQRQKHFTSISSQISAEINQNYQDLFSMFQGKSGLLRKPMYRKVAFKHLPAMIAKDNKFRARLTTLPHKVQCAVLASEIATLITYQGGWENELDSRVSEYLKTHLD